MEKTKGKIQIKAKGQKNKIEVQQRQKKEQVKNCITQKPVKQKNPQPLMKLYIYGSFQSDQYRYTNRQGECESQTPICITNRQRYRCDDWQDPDGIDTREQKIFINPLYRKSVVKIACGGMHSIALDSDGNVYTFGCNDQGALGRKGPQSIPLRVDLDAPVDLISAGDNHSLFGNSKYGIVYFTGHYNFQRGQKIEIEGYMMPNKILVSSMDRRFQNLPIQKLVSGSNHSCILINDKIICRGQPQGMTVGRERLMERRKIPQNLVFDTLGLRNVLDVWCGGYYTIAKTKKGQDFIYYGWGQNDKGQLGLGNREHQPVPIQIRRLRGQDIIKAACGAAHSLFLNNQGQIFVCGDNQDGALGLGRDYKFVQSDADPNQDNSDPEQQVQQQNRRAQNQVQKMQIQQPNIPRPIYNNNTGAVIEDLNNLSLNTQGPNNQLQIQIKQKQMQKQRNRQIQQNTYIRTIRKLQFDENNKPTQMITNISNGAQFSFAWNQKTQLYSWGFGYGYVLLNGQEEEEERPFKVNINMFNDQIIQDIQGGGSHVLYLAYQKTQNRNKPFLELSKKVKEWLGDKPTRAGKKQREKKLKNQKQSQGKDSQKQRYK